MKRKMTQDEILYAMWELVLIYKGERGRFIRSQGWGVQEFDQELAVRTMAGEFRKGIYNPVIRPEIRAKYERIREAV
jgi:hypothetical protein